MPQPLQRYPSKELASMTADASVLLQASGCQILLDRGRGPKSIGNVDAFQAAIGVMSLAPADRQLLEDRLHDAAELVNLARSLKQKPDIAKVHIRYVAGGDPLYPDFQVFVEYADSPEVEESP